MQTKSQNIPQYSNVSVFLFLRPSKNLSTGRDHEGNGQHITMYGGFIICGILDILVHYKIRFVPKNADYLASALAFAIELILFKFHLHGRSRLDIQIHTLLVYIVALNVITILAEMRYPNSVIAGLARAFFVILQGTWFYQVAFILYNPIPGAEPWDGENHEQMMITTIIFGWHMLIILIAMITIGAIVSCFIRRGDGGNYKDDEYDMESLIHRDNNGHTLLKMNADDAEDDSDFENEKPVSLKTLSD
ncbi:transmembrane protein 45B-like [Tubulanus polymorphus]|uniref:transmembrane protein 45B-like n=1 Tax=Tubulanus polymorphus TaxID=672921 RepID=UPI003DA672B9